MGAVRCAADNAMDNCLVVAQHAHFERGPLVAPHVGSEDDRVQFLILDAVPGLFWCPFAIKPLSVQKCTESDGSGTVGEEVQVWSQGPVGEEEKASAGPGCCEGQPPMDIQTKAFVECDHIEEAGDGGTAVDHPSQEGAASGDDLCCKAKGAYQ